MIDLGESTRNGHFEMLGVTPMFAVCFFGYGIGKKLQTPAGEDGQYTYAFDLI